MNMGFSVKNREGHDPYRNTKRRIQGFRRREEEVQQQNDFISEGTLYFDGEEFGEEKKGRPWWRMGRRCRFSFSSVCVRKRAEVEGIWLLCCGGRRGKYRRGEGCHGEEGEMMKSCSCGACVRE